VAVLAGNPLTLILAWAALDFAELLVMFWHVRSNEGRRQAALALSGKVLSLFLLLWAWIIAGQSGSSDRFEDLPEQAALYLLFAAWIRVVVPLKLPQMHEKSVQRGLGTQLRVISACAALVLFAHTAQVGFVERQAPYLLALAVLTALYGGLAWMYTKDEIAGHAYWIIGVAALAMASAVSGEEHASLAWGLTGLLSGGLLFLYSIRGRLLIFLPALGLLQMTCLPLTQAWNGVTLYGAVALIFSIPFLISQALLLAGYYSRADDTRGEKPDAERWVVVIYVWGLVLIALAQVFLALSGNIIEGKWVTPVNLAALVPGIAACALGAFFVFLQKRGYGLAIRDVRVINLVFSLNWLYYLLGRAYSLVGRGVALATSILEGEGGILWALLWLFLLFTLIAQGIATGV
jgi:hypothetical protein